MGGWGKSLVRNKIQNENKFNLTFLLAELVYWVSYTIAINAPYGNLRSIKNT